MSPRGRKSPPPDLVGASEAIVDAAQSHVSGELPATASHDRLVISLRKFLAAIGDERCTEGDVQAGLERLRGIPDELRPLVLDRLIGQIARVPNPSVRHQTLAAALARDLVTIALKHAEAAGAQEAWDVMLGWVRRAASAACFLPDRDKRIDPARTRALDGLGRPAADTEPKLGDIPKAVADFCLALLEEEGDVDDPVAAELMVARLAKGFEQMVAAHAATTAPPLLADALRCSVQRDEPIDVVWALLEAYARPELPRAKAAMRETHLRKVRDHRLRQRAHHDDWREKYIGTTVKTVKRISPTGSVVAPSRGVPSSRPPPRRAPQSPSLDEPAPQAVRVFVSSTFHDHQPERDQLVKRIFPRLRRLCEERGVAWAEVDLRWGISDEQAAERGVLPICLAEIDRSRPFFVGLLGERYGWVPEAIDTALVARHPWLEALAGRSVTELEMVYGVLNEPMQASGAFFYFRDPCFVDTVPPDERARYREEASEDEVRRFGRREAERRAADRRAELTALKERIRASGRPVRDGYTDVHQFGELVFRDLSEAIDQRFPASLKRGQLERAALDQAAFRSRLTMVYVGRADAFERLTAHAAGAGAPLIVVGEPGSGVSALLANWVASLGASAAHEARRKRPASNVWARFTTRSASRPFVLLHNVGASENSDDWVSISRRVIWELDRCFNLGITVPDHRDSIVNALHSALRRAAARRRIVLILDGVDRLDESEDASSLWWLPMPLPRDVRLIIGRRPWDSADPVAELGWPVLVVEGLNRDERRQLAVEYLGRYAKALEPGQLERLVAFDASMNPRILRTMLEEFRVYGEHETVTKWIDEYAASADRVERFWLGLDLASSETTTRFVASDLYRQVLSRLERDHDRERPGLVRETLTRLWASREGLAEADLVAMLAEGDAPLPGAFWSPLLLALEPWLLNRGGRIDIADPMLRVAIRVLYLETEASKAAIRLAIADYFEASPGTPGAFAEVSWQLQQANAWDRLFAYLARLPTTDPYIAETGELLRCWRALESARPDLSMLVAYRPILEAPARDLGAARWVATVMWMGGYPPQAATLEREVEKLVETVGGIRGARRTPLLSQAELLHQQGRLEEAETMLAQQEAISKARGDDDEMTWVRLQQAALAESRGDLATAARRYRDARRRAHAAGNEAGVAMAIGGRASLALLTGHAVYAELLANKQERLSRRAGEPGALSMALWNRGSALRARGRLDTAVEVLIEAERAARSSGDNYTIAAALWLQALARIDRRDANDIILELLNEAESFGRRSGSHLLTWQCVMARGQTLSALDPTGAAAAFAEAVRLARDIGLPDLLINALVFEGRILAALPGHRSDALVRLNEAYGLARKRGLAGQANEIAQAMAKIDAGH